jgi:uncharacterized protein (TIGR03435 family)
MMMLAMLAGAVWGQAPAFEVASVKVADPAAPLKVSGGPASTDPGRWTCSRCSLFSLLTHAYRMFEYQIVAPEWSRGTQFTVEATIPAGAKDAQFREMLQQLLAERFKMTAHREQREMSVYELVVAKGGIKMTDNSGGPPPAAPAQQPALDADGFPNVPGAFGMRMANGRGRMQFRQQTMANVAHFLSGPAGRPVLDATGLTGKYAITLSWFLETQPQAAIGTSPVPQARVPEGPDLFRALQDQLGLALESRKRPVEVLVVDKAERMPVEN